jgi:hypothetical protein
VTAERTILLVVHTGRDEATETARRVEKVLGDNGIGLRLLSAEAVDRGSLHLAPDDMRALGVDIEVVDADEARLKAVSSSSSSAATGPSCAQRSWPATSRSQCWASIWAASGSSPKPRRIRSTRCSTM